MRLFTPGPVPSPQRVLDACASGVLFHHGEEFSSVLDETWTNLQTIFSTDNPVVMLPGSGMSGMEACVASTVASSDRVVVFHHGRFGMRLVRINQIHGSDVIEHAVTWGDSWTPDHVRECLLSDREGGEISAVWFVHSETSTGVALDMASISLVVRELLPTALLLLDGVTSVGVQEVLPDTWGIDAVSVGVQKGLMSPPGLACVSLSERMQDSLRRGRDRRTYTLDLASYLDATRERKMVWTPPVTLVNGLREATRMMLEEGLQNVWNRQRETSSFMREALLARGFSSYGDGSSAGVVVVSHPQSEQIRSILRDRYGFVVAGGQDHMHGKIIRIGTCGPYTMADMHDLLDAIDGTIAEVH
ncbi:MAG: alanine--glyoxylate aminotransferase family protein [Ignavibacteria bacterium]|nr:alanine--glyoxylate aminotransferase family protein [Ignavibacteria bacterium]